VRDPDLDYRVVEHLLDLVSVFDADGRIAYASPSHERVLGYRPEELLGRSPLELVHESDRDAARAAFAQADGVPAAARLRHRDGHWVHLEWWVSAVPGPAGDRLVAVSRDVTARVRSDRLREAHFGVTRALASARSLDVGADEVLQVIAEQLGWDAGLLWRADVEARELRCVALWSAPSSEAGEFEAMSRELALRSGEGLPGRVWASGAPAWIPDVAADRGLPRRAAAERQGVRAGVAVPVDSGGTTWGVMEFFARETREPDGQVLDVLATLGAQLGQFVERIAAEQAVRDQERRKRAVVDAALDCVVTMDHLGRIVEFNPAAERTFGYAAADVVGRELADVLVPPALRDRHRAGLARYLETGEGTLFGRRVEMPALAAGGREIPVELTIARVDLPGPPVFSGYIRDITDRLRAEEALRESRALLQAVADGTPDALFVKDRAGRYLLMNEAGAHALGHDVEAILGASDAELLPPGTAAELVEADRRVVESGDTIVAEERIGDRTFLVTKAPYRGEGGEVVGVLGVAHDVTDRRRLEEELQHAQKMEAVGRLAGGVAHDFNNLLTVIRGFSDKALEQVAAGASAESSLTEVTRATDRATALTKQLLSLSRRAPLDLESLDLNAVVADMDPLLRRALGEDVRLVTVFGASPATVRANRTQLEQVTLNLAINARDAMPRGGQLTIETANATLDADVAGEMALHPGAHVLLRVSDAGSGMDAETRARAFEPFFTTKAPGRGTGLGLSTVYGIVTQCSGHVALQSSPGVGTTFTIHLPAAGTEAVAQASEPSVAPSLTRGTLLVAEDDDSLRALFEITLREQSYDVLTARSGEDALAVAALHGGEIDLLLTDVVMPGMRGTELAARLRQRQPGLRVIFATGYSDQPVLQELRPGDELLDKPFSMAELIDAITRVRGDEHDVRSSA
jgi:two-component system, cell cycle sensor histidine kinase and response regulator CckA